MTARHTREVEPALAQATAADLVPREHRRSRDGTGKGYHLCYCGDCSCIRYRLLRRVGDTFDSMAHAVARVVAENA